MLHTAPFAETPALDPVSVQPFLRIEALRISGRFGPRGESAAYENSSPPTVLNAWQRPDLR